MMHTNPLEAEHVKNMETINPAGEFVQCQCCGQTGMETILNLTLKGWVLNAQLQIPDPNQHLLLGGCSICPDCLGKLEELDGIWYWKESKYRKIVGLNP